MGKLEDAVSRLAKKVPKSAQFVDVGISDSSVAAYAAIQEFGCVQTVTPKQSAYLRYLLGGKGPKPGTVLIIPERPFMRATFRARHDGWTEAIQAGIRAFGTTGEGVRKALMLAGQTASEDIRETIENGGTTEERFPPRAELTHAIYAARSKGHRKDGSGNIDKDTPLQFSGDLISKIGYRLRGKE